MQILTEKQLADCLEITRASSKGLPKVIKVATYKINKEGGVYL